MAEVTGSEILAKALKKEGTKDLFFIMGGPMQLVQTTCRAEEIRMIDVRHEQAAALSAQAYARLLQKPGVCGKFQLRTPARDTVPIAPPNWFRFDALTIFSSRPVNAKSFRIELHNMATGSRSDEAARFTALIVADSAGKSPLCRIRRSR